MYISSHVYQHNNKKESSKQKDKEESQLDEKVPKLHILRGF